MNTITTLELLGCSLLGQFIHLLIKAKAIKSRLDAAGLKSNPFSELFQKDYINIMLSLIANVALLVAFKNTTQKEYTFHVFGIDITIDWRYVLFIFSGYTGSSFVLSLFSKLDKLKNEQLNNVSILTPTKMEEYIWELEFESATDEVDFESSQYSIEGFASMTGGEFSTTKIIYTEEPSFSEVTCIRIDTTTYTAGPIRKPKVPK